MSHIAGPPLPRELELETSTVSDAGASGSPHRAAGCVPVGRTVRDMWPTAGAQLGGEDRRLGAIGQLQLRQQGADVVLHRLDPQAEALGDLAVVETLPEQ